MAASQDVHVRICSQEIIKYDLEIKALIQDIRECTGPHSELTELNSNVKDKINQLRMRIQDLEQMAKEQDKESDKLALLNEMERHRKQMLSNQTAWRKANLSCKLAIDNSEKDDLLQGGDSSARQRTIEICMGSEAKCLRKMLELKIKKSVCVESFVNCMDLEQMAKEQDKESDKLALLNEMERHRKQMLSNQTAWRKANLSCKLAIDNSEKDDLLQGGDSSARQSHFVQDSAGNE
ncbi:Vesicle transport protein SEC20 [Acipenser ruthenus]|uniref:Vesicle transport protein SEC20 n=1 Tax=Acipenser ruthenus TaxID=7906 RepID=A0A444UUM1_ACIRT|nr:Vesicle transport protein SEC20 [Acipenser ruthenus]